MARIDCTNQKFFGTFRDLILGLRAAGFDAHHFHAVDLVEIPREEAKQIGEGEGPLGTRRWIMNKEGNVSLFEEAIIHLNLDWDRGGNVRDAAWSEGVYDEKSPLDQDPQGWYRLVADEYHERR